MNNVIVSFTLRCAIYNNFYQVYISIEIQKYTTNKYRYYYVNYCDKIEKKNHVIRKCPNNICLSVMTCYSYSSSLHCKCKSMAQMCPSFLVFCIWSFVNAYFRYLYQTIYICLKFVKNNRFTKFLLPVSLPHMVFNY